jgi:hypothetical protein
LNRSAVDTIGQAGAAIEKKRLKVLENACGRDRDLMPPAAA